MLGDNAPRERNGLVVRIGLVVVVLRLVVMIWVGGEG